ncbi:hypothetical protein LTS18_011400, partial [Coniosporium uncinatum]
PEDDAAAVGELVLDKRRGPKAHKQMQHGSEKAARALGIGAAAVELMEAGIVGLEARRGERVGRIRLGVGDEEVRLALREDEEVRGLGFNA